MAQSKHLDPGSMAEFYGAELRRRREETGLSQEELGNLVFCSGTYVGQMEVAARRPQLDLSERMDGVLGADGFFRRLCGAILKASRFAGYFAAAADLEQRALAICDFATTVVPGLLQTPAYTRALIRSLRPLVGEEEVERIVDARQARVRVLLKYPAEPELWFILHETLLGMPVGGTGVMREQLRHLADISRTHRAIIQILPLSAGVTPLIYGPMRVMTFLEEPSAAYTETAHSGQLIEDPAVVATIVKSYDLARAAAMSPEASLAFIDRLLEEDHTP
ncbi:helix-turn-helix transcriptional regulator [Streptomyces canus]|uniref:helix-turn-helix domain-containing protein n=1 Tax=Streptomyces canus TaxID=58343 RepID=UPI002E352C2C|nr:helix-turn-helix transcriptional regulator [Streptomyces canus]